MINWYANKLDIYIWDVGHGLSVTVITPFVSTAAGVVLNRRRVIQIDAGVNQEYEFFPITHLVHKRGLRFIDYLILSHPDKDHIDELPKILQMIASGHLNVNCLIRNRTIPNESISEIATEEGPAKSSYKYMNDTFVAPIDAHNILHPLNFGGVTVETQHLIHTPTFNEPNNLSVVANIKFGNTQIIIPGDIEEAGVNLLLGLNKMPFAEPFSYRILLAPHHGSRTAKPAKFLAHMKPHIVLASSEKDHEYTDSLYSSPSYVIGHPVIKSNGITEVSRFNATKGEALHIETIGTYPVIRRIPYEKTTPSAGLKALTELLSGMR
jgi:competence protein ComEC